MKVGIIVRYTKKAIEKNEGWGQIWPQVAVWGLRSQYTMQKTQDLNG